MKPSSLAVPLPPVYPPLDTEYAVDDPDSKVPSGLRLLDDVDRRQNEVMAQLDELNARIEAMVKQCQAER